MQCYLCIKLHRIIIDDGQIWQVLDFPINTEKLETNLKFQLISIELIMLQISQVPSFVVRTSMKQSV